MPQRDCVDLRTIFNSKFTRLKLFRWYPARLWACVLTPRVVPAWFEVTACAARGEMDARSATGEAGACCRAASSRTRPRTCPRSPTSSAFRAWGACPYGLMRWWPDMIGKRTTPCPGPIESRAGPPAGSTRLCISLRETTGCRVNPGIKSADGDDVGERTGTRGIRDFLRWRW